MPIEYTKPFLTLDQQVDLLISRGMQVSDRVRAKLYLGRLGYYRLSAYWYPFRQINAGAVTDNFVAGTEFSHSVDLYVFDKRLRLLLLDAIERIEVAFRVEIAQVLGLKDMRGHLNPQLLDGKFTRIGKDGRSRYDKWLENFRKLEERSNETFVEHYRKKYSGTLPIWIAVELWDFGLTSHLLEGLQFKDQQSIASKYGISAPTLASWLRTINHVRNIAAHHSRLWNKNLVDRPSLPKAGEAPTLDHLRADVFAQSRVYAGIAIIQYLMMFISPTSTWCKRLKSLTDRFPNAPRVHIQNMGFPKDWHLLPLWKTCL